MLSNLFKKNYWEQLWKRVLVFILNIPSTIKETFIWLLLSYLIPVINVGIIWGMEREAFVIDLNIVSIILVTNACFLTSLIYIFNSSENTRKLATVINIATYVITVVFFTVSIIQIQNNNQIFSLTLFKNGALWTLIFSIILGLISKYDEVKAMSKLRAKKSKGVDKTTVDGTQVKI